MMEDSLNQSTTDRTKKFTIEDNPMEHSTERHA